MLVLTCKQGLQKYLSFCLFERVLFLKRSLLGFIFYFFLFCFCLGRAVLFFSSLFCFVWLVGCFFCLFVLLLFLFSYQEIGKPHISLVPIKTGFGQCCLAAYAMSRVTQFQLRAFFKAEHLRARKVWKEKW